MMASKSSTSGKKRAVVKTKASPAAKIAKNGSSKTLDDLLLHGLKDIYYAEKKIYKSLPKMIKAAQDEELSGGLESHRGETEGHVEKLEQIFDLMGLRAVGTQCDAIDGILEECDGILGTFGKSRACDAAIIFAGQAVEHYEITRYGSLHAFANALGKHDVAEILDSILIQEKTADEKLTALAVDRLNSAAEMVQPAAM